MKVIVDTSVWLLALRRAKRVDDIVQRGLSELIEAGRVIILGPVRQELLSGIKERNQFDQLQEHLRAFPDLELETADYEAAAYAFNRCRERGIQGSNTDFLLCAAALRRDKSIFTTDGDFRHYARVLGIKLYEPQS